MTQLIAFARRHALFASLLVSSAALLLVAVRIGLTGSELFVFLPRNLMLGWLPVWFALGLAAAVRLPLRWLTGPVFAVLWLLFLPNSIYLLTDLIHIRARAGVPHVYDGTMVGLFAAAGVLAGLSALSVFHEVVSERLGAVAAWSLLVPLFPLCGLGVWMGRYERWNSWDAFSRPSEVFWAVAEPALHLSPVLWTTTSTYAVVFAVSWLAFCTVRQPATS